MGNGDVYDFDKTGLGVRGLSRHVEDTVPDSGEEIKDLSGHVAPAGTTEAQVTEEEGRCAVCGAPTKNWNPGAGQYLCSRHWDCY